MNVLKINGIAYENKFKIFVGWTLKKKFNCRKCKVEVGLFTHNNIKKEKLVWIDLLKCEENYYDQLNQLQVYKAKYKEQNGKYYENRFENFDLEFHKKIRKGFLDIANKYKERCVLVNAELSQNEISKIIVKEINKMMNLIKEL